VNNKKRRGGRVTPSTKERRAAGDTSAVSSRLALRSSRSPMPAGLPTIRPAGIRPGVQSPRRDVPASIPRPPYASD
jgi:hypothetical protein